jgi:hypothetical protein
LTDYGVLRESGKDVVVVVRCDDGLWVGMWMKVCM